MKIIQHKKFIPQNIFNGHLQYKLGLMCTLTHLSDQAMVEDVIITCVCGYLIQLLTGQEYESHLYSSTKRDLLI